MRGYHQGTKRSTHKRQQGFTIVELLIVVVVIAILAAITIVAYSGITAQAKEAALKTDLTTAAKKLNLEKVESGSFPVAKPSDLPDSIQYSQTSSGQGFCVTAVKDGKVFHITQYGTIQSGACSGHTIAGGGGGGTEIAANSPIQNVTPAQCAALPTFTGSNNDAVRTVTDDRGGTTRTYEIAKLADGKCWMLDNLKLGSTTGSITLTPSDSDVAGSFSLPGIWSGTSSSRWDNNVPYTFGPVPGDTGSGITNYGYLYNWSAVTAGANTTSNPPGSGNASNSICAAGWRLPSGGTPDSDFSRLDIAFGGTGAAGSPTISSWEVGGPFRGLLAGVWSYSWSGQGLTAGWWSSSAHSTYTAGYNMYINGGNVTPANSSTRYFAYPVRCLLR